MRYDKAMKLFYKFCIWAFAFVAAFTFGPDAALAQYTADEYIVRFSGFLERIILPLLFSIAFLFFIYNTAKYFIFHGDEDGSREEGKRNAIYSVAAFVFLISIWFIVGLFTQGLGLYNRQSICADYFSLFGGNCDTATGGSFGSGGTTFPGSGGTGGSGTGTGGSGPGTGGTGTGGTGTGGSGTSGGGTGTGDSGSGGTGGSGTGGGTTVGNDAPLAELIFGTGKDGAGYHRSLVVSSALASTPNVPQTASCIDGVNTLKLAARAESTQAAYLYYETSAGQPRWRNITDRTSQNYIGYDRDVLDDIINAGATKLHIVHLHPDSRVDALGLPMNSHGPSTADMQLMCTLNNPAIAYVTIDETNVWVTRQNSTTCPYVATAIPQLAILETYTTLIGLDASARQAELEDYLASSLVPAVPKAHFNGINRTTLADLDSTELLALTTPIQTTASTTVRLFATTDAFCSSR